FPEPKQRTPPTEVHAVAGLIASKGRLLVVRLPENATRWAGMWGFPSSEVDVAELVTVVRHGVTRFRITLDAYRCRIRAGRARPRAVSAHAWKRPSELADLAMPSP